jgi:hypothetical protein
MPEGRRSRRAKAKPVNYGREQEFSDGDVFEDSDDEPTPKRGRPKGSRKSTSAAAPDPMMSVHDDLEEGGVYRPSKPIYNEKGYDTNLAPIRERFPFLPEFEPDGSPRIDMIVGRRPVDEKEATDADATSENENENQDPTSDDDEESDSAGVRKGRRGGGKRKADKKSSSPSKKEDEAGPVEYEYLVKYKGRSYLHLEWKTGADLESMNKSAKTLYRRYLKKLTVTHDEELEDPNFDPSYAVVQKICAKEEQEITMELSDKDLLEWEKEREKEIAEEDSDDDEPEVEGAQNGKKTQEGPDVVKENGQQPEASTDEKKGNSPHHLTVHLFYVTAANFVFVETLKRRRRTWKTGKMKISTSVY